MSDGLDRLESPQRRRARPRGMAGALLLVGGVIVVVVSVVVLVGTGGSHRPAHPRATGAAASTQAGRPAPLRASAAAAVATGPSVFLESLPGCVRLDRQQHLRVAMAVTDLGPGAIRLLSATPVVDAAGVHPVGVRIGTGRCAEASEATARILQPPQAVVVVFTLAADRGCPRRGSVSARLVFEVGARLAHTDSADLVDLGTVRWPGCGA